MAERVILKAPAKAATSPSKEAIASALVMIGVFMRSECKRTNTQHASTLIVASNKLAFMTMTLAQRLIHARTTSGFDEPAKVAKLAGITPSALYQLEDHEGGTKSLSGETAVKLGRIYSQFRLEWLIAGEGSPTRTRVTEQAPLDYVGVASREMQPGYVRLPLLSMVAAMGDGSGNNDPHEVVQFLDVADWWASQHLPHDLARVKIISSRGDSNAPLINHGDVVFVDTGVNYFDGEGLYVFNWQGRALIKRLAPNLRSGRMQIISANPAYPAEDISTDEIEQLHIAGRVAAWWTLRTH